MWSLRLKEDGSFYLTYDMYRRYTNSLPGVWELVGPKDLALTKYCVKVNELRGLLSAEDDQGNMRTLVLEHN